MTAEIAIINRNAVTLAADSALTLSIGDTDKISNSADKIFELSVRDPIGIMMYNNVDFMRIPLDLVIKTYRDRLEKPKLKSLEDCAEDFFKYLEKEIGITDGDQEQHLLETLVDVYSDFKNLYMSLIFKVMISNDSAAKKVKAFDQEFESILELKISDYEKYSKNKEFEDIDEGDFILRNLAIFDKAVSGMMDGIVNLDPYKDKIYRLGALSILRNKFSSSYTGLVFAGYCGSDMFPSLYSYQIDGIFDGKLKKKRLRKAVIDKNNLLGRIIPFAQREMVDRFIVTAQVGLKKAIDRRIPGGF